MIPRLLFAVVKMVAMARKRRRGDETVAGGSAWQLRGIAPTPNDQRSNVKNPNNPAHRAAANDRSDQMNPNNPAHRAAANNGSDQMNPNNPAYRSSRGLGGGGRKR